jgi:hypothetical protein
MAIDWISKVWKAAADRPKMVSPGELLILLGIADHCDELGRAYPAVTTLARKSLMTRRSAQKAIRRMEAVGILTTDQGTGGRFDPRGVGPRGRSLYAFTDPQHWPQDRGGAIPASHGTPPPQTAIPASHGTPPPASHGTPPPASHGTPKPSLEPLIEKQTQIEADAAGAAMRSGILFQAFWAAYPRRAGPEARRQAESAWGAEIDGGTSPETLASAARAYAEECNREKIAPRYVKQAAGWIKSGGFEDYSTLTLPLGEPIDPKELRYNHNKARFEQGLFAPLVNDWNRPEIVNRALLEGFASWDIFRENGWNMPEPDRWGKSIGGNWESEDEIYGHVTMKLRCSKNAKINCAPWIRRSIALRLIRDGLATGEQLQGWGWPVTHSDNVLAAGGVSGASGAGVAD